MKIPAELAREIAWCDKGTIFKDRETGLEVTVIENRHVGERRWVSEHELVIKDDAGRFWHAMYERGLTESQDTRPFDEDSHGNGPVEFTEVRRKVVEAYEYEKIPSA